MRTIKMLSVIAFPLLGCTFVPVSAQAIMENEPAIIYYMPKTILLFDVEYEREEMQTGIFYQYSERYLGTKNVITENKVVYRLKNVQLHTKTVADHQRSYKITPDSKLLSNYLSVTDEGVLCAVNAPCETKTQPTVTATAKEELPANTLMPLGEEQMLANSVAKMAEGAAKQIYRIRESRLNLLSGDVDKMPNDGESMQIVLEELNKSEQALCELFIGKRSTQTLHKTMLLTPDDNIENQVFFRFSSFSGVVAADDLSGSPVHISLTANKQTYASGEKKKAEAAGLYYNLPGTATIILSSGKEQWINETLPIAQFGISMALPHSMFEKSDIKLHFDTQTGALKSIEK